MQNYMTLTGKEEITRTVNVPRYNVITMLREELTRFSLPDDLKNIRETCYIDKEGNWMYWETHYHGSDEKVIVRKATTEEIAQHDDLNTTLAFLTKWSTGDKGI